MKRPSSLRAFEVQRWVALSHKIGVSYRKKSMRWGARRIDSSDNCVWVREVELKGYGVVGWTWRVIVMGSRCEDETEILWIH